MTERLRILHLEDDPDYSRLVQDLLAKEHVSADLLLVKSQAEFEAALANQKFDVILADYLLPYYTGVRALATAREKCPTTPFLLVSGTIGEQAAIESLNAGATDYVLKQWPERLVPAVRRAIREAKEQERRRHVETELIRREKYFRALTENSLDILAIVNREGTFQYLSPSVKRVLGYDPQKLAGQGLFGIVKAEDLPDVMRAFGKGLKHPEATFTMEFRVRNQDDSWVHLEGVGQNRLDDREIAAVVLNLRDIGDRKRAEDALRESEKEYRLLFHGNPNPMWVSDMESMKFLEVNDAAVRHYGYSHDEFLSMTIKDIRPPEEVPAMLEYRQKVLKEGVKTDMDRMRVWQHRKKDGTIIDVQVEWSLIQFMGHSAALTLVNDITAQKRLEEQFRQSQKMDAIGQLAGGVAHDFNNILTVIHGHASLLVTGGMLEGKTAKSVQQILQASERAAGLTRQLLTFSRRQVMQPRRLDMNEVVGNLTKMLSRILGEDITLQVNNWPRPALVQADMSMMEQVLLNLSVNARDAMPKGGQLTVKISIEDVGTMQLARRHEARAGRFVCLTTTDTGSGIAPQNLRRIFEPFFTTKEVGKGTGLGLATVYGIVNQHHGWIEVESELNKGTSFRVYLPYSGDVSEKKEDESHEAVVRGGKETVLVVEDEGSVRELVCGYLRQLGYNVLEAESGVKAVKVWQSEKGKVDLLLTDLVMPDQMNGRELAEKLRAERPDLKVIFTSGYSADVVGKEFVLQPGLNYLQKPYHPQKLALVVRDCLDGKEPGPSM